MNENFHSIVGTILLQFPHLNFRSVHALDRVFRVAILPDVRLLLVEIDEQLVRFAIDETHEILIQPHRWLRHNHELAQSCQVGCSLEAEVEHGVHDRLDNLARGVR